MKTVVKLFGILSLVLLVMSSFTVKQPDDDMLEGTYKGHVEYVQGEDVMGSDNGTVTVIKGENGYTLNFSDEIPALENLDLKQGENVFQTGWDDASVIVIDGNSLTVKMSKDGESWTANCERE